MKLPMLSFIFGSSLGWVIILRVRNGDFCLCVIIGDGDDDGVGTPAVSKF